MQTYQHSGAVPAAGGVLMCVGGALAAVLGGVIYTYAIVYIPIVYVNGICPFAFGAAIGAGVGWAARLGKVRNSLLVMMLAWLFAICGIYVEWGITPLALGFEGVGLHGFDPLVIKAVATFLYTEGSWGMSDGEPVKGPALAFVWLVEAVIIIGMAHYIARNAVSETPFCERCDKWTVKDCTKELRGTGQEPDWAAALSGNVDALTEMPLTQPWERAGVRLTLWSCESCDDSSYLSIEPVTYTTDGAGNFKEKKTSLVKDMILDARQTQVVRDCGRELPDSEADEDETE